MGDTLVDVFAQGIDAFITAMIVSFMVLMIAQQQSMAAVVQENHINALQMQEYREYNAYQTKHVYAADIISLILKKKGYPTIEVRTAAGSTLTWSLSVTSVPYNVDRLYQSIDPRYIYDSTVEYEDTINRQGVKKLIFKVCTDPNCPY